VRVLVVDDNPDVLEATIMVLQFVGHAARGAADGMLALEEVQSFEPHVILIDCSLPDMTGYELARRVCSRTGARRPYLAMVSGTSGAAHTAASFAAGFDELVMKPACPTTLEAILERAQPARTLS
jgi:CheY-like chemotaxis protein